jgi:acyl carrier protein
VREELRKFIIDSFLFGREDDTFSDGDSFFEKGLIDSTGVLELVGFLEEKYGCKIEYDELVPENLDSIDNLVRFLDRKLLAGLTEDKFAGPGVSGR